MDEIKFLDSTSEGADKNVQYALIRMVHSICLSLDLSSSLVCGIYGKDIDDEYDIQIVTDLHDNPRSSQFPCTIKDVFESNKSNMDLYPKHIDLPNDIVDDQDLETLPGVSSEMLIKESYTKIGVLCKSGNDCWYVMIPGSIVPRVIYFRVGI